MFKEKILSKIKEYDLEKLQRQYDAHPNYGKIDINNFLPEDITQQCADELDQLPLEIGLLLEQNTGLYGENHVVLGSL